MDKLAICYTCCGPTYRKTARDKLINLHKDNKDIFYFVITEDADYFKDVKRKNLIVKNLKDFYTEYPHVEKYESFLESENLEDYANKFLATDYRFPFSVNRFNFILAKEYNIKNVALLGTDTDINLNCYKSIQNKLKPVNKIYNVVGRWPEVTSNFNMSVVVDLLKTKYNLTVDEKLVIFDAAGKLFCFDKIDDMMRFFNIWDDIIETLYKTNKIPLFHGSYAVNNEYILAPIYNALNITDGQINEHAIAEEFGVHVLNLFTVNHNPEVERPWI
jgi:hypothetical protein